MSIWDWVGLTLTVALGFVLLALTAALMVSALSTKHDPIEWVYQRLIGGGRK